MNNQPPKNLGQLEQERKEIVRQGNQLMSDELKDAVDLAYKLSFKKPEQVEVKTLTSGSI